MFIENLTNNQLRELVEDLAKKYNLRKRTSATQIYEAVREDKYFSILLTRDYEYNGPKTEVNDYCIVSDFNFYSNVLYNEDLENVIHDFRRLMFAHFGDEYKKSLKHFLENDKKSRMSELNEELEIRNSVALEELVK